MQIEFYMVFTLMSILYLWILVANWYLIHTTNKPCLIKGEYRQLMIRKLVGQRNWNAFLFMCFLFFPYPIFLSRIIGIIFQTLTTSFYISVFGSIIQSGIVFGPFFCRKRGSVQYQISALWTKEDSGNGGIASKEGST